MWKLTGLLATTWVACIALGIALEYLYVNLNGCPHGDLLVTCMTGAGWGGPRALYLFAINSIVFASPLNFALSGIALAYWTDRMLFPTRRTIAAILPTNR